MNSVKVIPFKFLGEWSKHTPNADSVWELKQMFTETDELYRCVSYEIGRFVIKTDTNYVCSEIRTSLNDVLFQNFLCCVSKCYDTDDFVNLIDELTKALQKYKCKFTGDWCEDDDCECGSGSKYDGDRAVLDVFNASEFHKIAHETYKNMSYMSNPDLFVWKGKDAGVKPKYCLDHRI